ncbi:MAG: NAD(P)H-dependent oxidoreductase subunit E [Gammaproteobacteria bacterium]|nr:NAD(P)H-dependent oxidoreductase subunit E [Gammaproteobacteria bacterium]MDE0252488.1 NAD(P)H-dependent oxidoreductase subunit E [Gammaproteobacteria bacterium]MDE0403513.1 NAD(P)H-dependent oxidoreductase subunit E [Gammaproteobacteria bacterium]
MSPSPHDFSNRELKISDKQQALRDGIAPYASQLGGLIRALHWVQHKFGYINPEHYVDIADVFNLSVAEVRGVVSFYHDFRTSPPPKHTIRICQAEACQAQGVRELTEAVEKSLNTKMNSQTSDGSMELKAVYCLGLCSLGPSMEINGELIAKATVKDLERVKR